MISAVHQFPIQHLTLHTEGGQDSHLAVRLEAPSSTSTNSPAAVLYMHGFGSGQSGTKADFFRQRVLDLGLAFCSFDFQGHGKSGGSMFDLSLTRNLSDIAAVHDHLRGEGFESVVLMGSSMGGGSGLWYAAKHPAGIDAAVHIAPSVALDEGLLKVVGPEAAQRWQADGKLLFEHELANCDISWNLIEDLRAYRIEELQTLYRTPTLILQGKNDTSVPWDKVTSFVVNSEFEEIDLHLMADADHRMIDRLDYLWRLMHEFLITRGVVSEDRTNP